MIVTEEELKEATGYSNVALMVSNLKSQGVSFLQGKGGRVFTTIDSLNFAMELPQKDLAPSNHKQLIEV